MFFRVKPSGPRSYLQLVENFWDQGRTKQRVLLTLGRLDQLQQSGQFDSLLASGARLSQKLPTDPSISSVFIIARSKPGIL